MLGVLPLKSPISSWTEEKLAHFIRTSRFQKAADVWIHSAEVLNVYTGEILKWNVAICEDRIAYVGEKEPLIDDRTEIINGIGYILVPGYIEPHSHPFQIYHPFTLSEYALSHGTTTLLNDNMNFYLQMTPESLERFYNDMSRLPVKNFWWARLDPQNTSAKLKAMFKPERIERLLSHPATLQAGELTGWMDVVNTDEDMMRLMALARNSGKRIEAHNPGASHETLAAMAAAGASGCHESITTEEVLRRLRLGMAAILRHSSIRPDLPALIKGLLEVSDFNVPWNRLMLTTDGSPPYFFEHGFTDFILNIAIDAGLDPIRAYQMVTVNPAAYYGLDADIGGIAPGRIADIVFLKNINNPVPDMVMANGRIAASSCKLTSPLPEPEWDAYEMITSSFSSQQDTSLKKDSEITGDMFQIKPSGEAKGKFPVMKMLNAVILKEEWLELPIKDEFIAVNHDDQLLYAALLDPDGQWLTTGILKGFAKIDALASSYSVAHGIVVLGRDRNQMAEAVRRVQKSGGGICLMENGEPLFELPLPLLGGMSYEPMDVLIQETGRIVDLFRERGYIHEDPLYTILFLSATHLPALRLTAEGLLSVKTNQIVVPTKTLK
jgi:adenine deaminase